MHATNQEIKECIDLRACSYTNWSKKFRKITLESVCIALPDQMVKYLLDEIIILPKECYGNEPDDTFGDDADDADDIVVSLSIRYFNECALKCVFRLDCSNRNFPNSVHRWRTPFHDLAELFLSKPIGTARKMLSG